MGGDEDGHARVCVAAADGGVVSGGGRALADAYPAAFYAHPAVVEMPSQKGVMLHETFAPILYVTKIASLAMRRSASLALSCSAPRLRSMARQASFLADSTQRISPAVGACGVR